MSVLKTSGAPRPLLMYEVLSRNRFWRDRSGPGFDTDVTGSGPEHRVDLVAILGDYRIVARCSTCKAAYRFEADDLVGLAQTLGFYQQD